MGRTLTWECIWYRPKPEGFTERTYGKVYGLYFHYKDIITTLWTTWKMKARRRTPEVLTLNTTGFILSIYFQTWLLCTCDFPRLQWFQSSRTCFSLLSHYSTSMSPCSCCLHSFSYWMTTEKFLKKNFHKVTNNYLTIEEHLVSAFAIINHLPTHTKIMSVSFPPFQIILLG